MVDSSQLALLKKGVQNWNDWREINDSDREIDLRKANLSGVNLTGVDLRSADLSEANLTEVDLRVARLNNANLSGACLNNANLSGARLNNANLNGAVLTNINLNGARLNNANLNGAVLTNINFNGAILSGAILSSVTLRSITLRGATLRSITLSHSDLSGADLSAADLTSANLSEANLSEANLSKAHLREANLNGANLSNANLKNAYLRLAHLREASLDRANLSHANLSNANLSEAYLREVDLSGADLGNICLLRADLNRANLSHANLSNANLSEASLREANLSEADLSGADFSKVNLREANLSNANLDEADLSWVNLSESNLNGANLSRTQSLHTSFSNAVFSGACIEDWHIGNSTRLDGIVCDYIFRTTDHNGKFSGRLPVDKSSFFIDGEFTQRFQILASALETIDLTFTEGIDWQAFFQSFQEVCHSHSTENLSIQSMERKGEAFVVRLETNADIDKAVIETEIKQLYAWRTTMLETQYAEKLKLQGIQIEEARETIQVERHNNATLMGIIAGMAENQSSKYEFNGPVGSVVDTAASGSRVQSVLHNYAPEQRQNLAAAAKEIKTLLEQLSESYALAEIPAQAVGRIQQNPQLKERVMGALKNGGKTALEKLVDHPAISIVLAAIEGASNIGNTK